MNIPENVEQETMPERLARSAYRAMPWLLGFAMAAAVFSRAYIIPRHVHNIGFSEMNVVDGVIRLMDGYPLYGDPEKPPFDIIQYSPIHYYITWACVEMLGLEHDRPNSIYMVNRVVSLLANLITLLVLWRLGAHLRLELWLRLLLMGLMFTWMHEPFFSRPDSIYQLCCAVFFGAALRTLGQGRLSWAGAMRLGVWSALVLFCKQSGVGPVLAVGCGLLLTADRHTTFRYATGVLLFNVLFLAALCLHDGWHNVYSNLVLGNVNGFGWPWFAFDPREPYIGMGLWITPAALFIGWRYRKLFSTESVFLLVAAIVMYAWAFITAFKVGSNMNYFMEHWLACSIICVLFISRSASTHSLFRDGLALALCAIVLLRATWFTKVFVFSGYPPDQIANYNDDLAAIDELRAHGLQATDAVFVVGEHSFIDQALGTRAWMKMKDIIRQSQSNLVLDHRILFDPERNGQLRFLLSADSTAFVRLEKEVFTGFHPSFRAGRYTAYERDR